MSAPSSEPDDEQCDQRVVIADRQLESLPEDLSAYLDLPPSLLSRVTRLSVHDTRIARCPGSLGRLTGLVSLELPGNRLCDLPDELAGLPLRRLVLAGNRLDRLPACLFLGLGELRELDVSGNAIAELPTPPRCAARLRSLHLGDNLLSSLPDWLDWSCGALRSLRAPGNGRLSRGPELRAPLHSLDLTDCALPALRLLAALTGLQELRVGNSVGNSGGGGGGNCFWDFPNEVLRQAETLSLLSLRGTCLSQLPREIGLLRSLVHLDVRHCQLHTLPQELGQLASLRSLLLSANRLVALPATVAGLGSLRELRLDGNRLELLPDSLSQLSGLEVLDLYDNCLDQWQAGLLEQLSSLRAADCERNFAAAANTERYQRLRRCLRSTLYAAHRLDGTKPEEEPSSDEEESCDSDGSLDDWQVDETDGTAETTGSEQPQRPESDWGDDNPSESDDDLWSPPENWSVGSLQRVKIPWPPPIIPQKTFVTPNGEADEGQFAEVATV